MYKRVVKPILTSTILMSSVVALLMPPNTQKAEASTVARYDAQKIIDGKTPQLTLRPGADLSIDFSELGEAVSFITVADPSRVVAIPAGDLCPTACAGGAQHVFLRRTKGIKLENIHQAATTTVHIITVSPEGKKQYTFKVGFGAPLAAAPTTIRLEPTKQDQSPSIRQDVIARPDPDNIDKEAISSLTEGLAISRRELIDNIQNRRVFSRIEQAIGDLKVGYTLKDSLRRNHLDQDVADALFMFAKEGTTQIGDNR